MQQVGVKAKIASNNISHLNIVKKNLVLKKFRKYLIINSKLILKENKKDISNAKLKKISTSMIDRLSLDEEKIFQIAKSLNEIIKFKDPVGKVLSSWKRPNGLIIKRVSIPLGVVGVIYESRPNVTSDIAALCFKAGSAVILRGGSEAFYSNKILAYLFRKALISEKCNKNCVQLVKSKDRRNVDYLLSKMQKYGDVIIARGGKNLIKKVQTKSKIPTIGHLEGICHVYVDKKADLDMSVRIVKNAKMRNVSICGAAETLLIDSACLKTHCTPILNALTKLGCSIIGDEIIKKEF